MARTNLYWVKYHSPRPRSEGSKWNLEAKVLATTAAIARKKLIEEMSPRKIVITRVLNDKKVLK